MRNFSKVVTCETSTVDRLLDYLQTSRCGCSTTHLARVCGVTNRQALTSLNRMAGVQAQRASGQATIWRSKEVK